MLDSVHKVQHFLGAFGLEKYWIDRAGDQVHSNFPNESLSLAMLALGR